MLIRDAIGEVLRRRRRESSKTLDQLARESRVSLPYLSEIERGRKEVSSEVLATICRSLDVPINTVLLEVSELLELSSILDSAPVTSIRPADRGTELLMAA
jgi:transcriptional regulator with XRE-family HTH domain